MQGGYAHGQGASFPRFPEIHGHWGAAAKQRGAESRHIPLASAEAQRRTALCANKRETADGCVTDTLVGVLPGKQVTRRPQPQSGSLNGS